MEITKMPNIVYEETVVTGQKWKLVIEKPVTVARHTLTA